MIILWDSSTMNVKLIVVSGDVSTAYEWEAGRSLAKDMLAFMRDKLAMHDATFRDIHSIGVFRGPGSFTGLRIGMTVLNTLADTLDIPIVGEVGDAWQSRALQHIAEGKNDSIVLPEYGGDAHITKPRK